MKPQDFRLYRFLDAPFQFYGFTLPHIVVVVVGLVAFFNFESWVAKVLSLVLTTVAFSSIRQISKMFAGVSFRSWSRWHLGYSGVKFPQFIPKSYMRIIGG